MRITGEQVWSLLRTLDDPDHLEWPEDYDFDYVVVPEWDLWQDDDGPSEITVPGARPGTWWLRFFDYL